MKFLDKHQVFIMHGNLIYTIFFNEMIISYTCVSLLPIFHSCEAHLIWLLQLIFYHVESTKINAAAITVSRRLI